MFHKAVLLCAAVGLCVYTLKEGVFCKMRFDSGRLTTAQQVLEKMREAFGIPEEIEQVFSIWLTSKHLRKLSFSLCSILEQPGVWSMVSCIWLCTYQYYPPNPPYSRQRWAIEILTANSSGDLTLKHCPRGEAYYFYFDKNIRVKSPLCPTSACQEAILTEPLAPTFS